MKMTTSNKLTKKELNQVFWRSFGLEWSWNYERQMNMSYCYSMLPVIKKLYPNKEDQVAAMKRHLEFFNTTPQLATLILGIHLGNITYYRYWCGSIISKSRKYLRTYLIFINLQPSSSGITLLFNEYWL